MSNKTVTKSFVSELRNQGKNVKEILEVINGDLPVGKKVSEAVFSKQCKAWGINLRSKIKPANVMFIDDTNVTKEEAPVSTVAEAEAEIN